MQQKYISIEKEINVAPQSFPSPGSQSRHPRTLPHCPSHKSWTPCSSLKPSCLPGGFKYDSCSMSQSKSIKESHKKGLTFTFYAHLWVPNPEHGLEDICWAVSFFWRTVSVQQTQLVDCEVHQWLDVDHVILDGSDDGDTLMVTLSLSVMNFHYYHCN